MSETLQIQPKLPRNLMLCIAFGQGIALFLLWRAMTNETWLSETPTLNFPLWTLALVAPTMLQLCLDTTNLARSLKAVGFFTGVLMLAAAYTGWQASPHGEFPIRSLVALYVLTTLIASFKGLMYCQQWIAKAPPNYAALFTYSWRNFLVAALASALALGVALILALWAGLFAVIRIEFFAVLFSNDWFLFPVLNVAFGTGIVIFRRLVKVIDGITSLLEGLMRLLLPLVAVVLVVFLGALPVTTLEPLWATGSGTALLLWLNAFALFFVNAVYQTGHGSPYPYWVHRGLSVAIALLPIVSCLALYGLYLRIAEYGWTAQRCWAFTVFAILALFSAGYAGCIARWRWEWPRHLGRVNTLMGWVVLALMVLVNSPLLDFRSISLASQWQRVESGEVELRNFDFHYAKNHLARPGYEKVQALIAEYESSDPELVASMRAAERAGRKKEKFAILWENLTYRPEPFEPAPGLRDAIAKKTTFGRVPDRYFNPVLVRVDLDEDGTFEYVLVAERRSTNYWIEAVMLFRDGDGWRSADLAPKMTGGDDLDYTEALLNGEIKLVDPRFKNLKLGDLLLHEVY